MDFLQIALLSFIQGVTEFLPVSSSGHLALVPSLTGWKDQGQFLDVALHVGTLGAVCVYFIKDIFYMFIGFIQRLFGKRTEGGELAVNIIIASIPAVIVGLSFQYTGLSFRSVPLIAANMAIFGVILGLADKAGASSGRISKMTYAQAFLIGIGQSIALIPGVSRSGACLTISRLMGFERIDATRFTFLLAIPAIAGAACLTGYQAYHSSQMMTFGRDALWLMGGAFFFGLFSIHFIIRYLRNGTFMPFVFYRLALGGILYLWTKGYLSFNLTPVLPTP